MPATEFEEGIGGKPHAEVQAKGSHGRKLMWHDFVRLDIRLLVQFSTIDEFVKSI